MSCKFIPITEWDAALRGNHIVYIANTSCKRKQGLQGIKKMPIATLVLFLGITSGTYMHTQNCHFPIDIIYLSDNGVVLDHVTAQPNQEHIGPAPMGTSKVLEAPGGWCSSNHINQGDSLRLYSSASER